MSETIIDINAAGNPCTPYWNEMVCGDRAGLALRSDYRDCLAKAVKGCGFRSLPTKYFFGQLSYSAFVKLYILIF